MSNSKMFGQLVNANSAKYGDGSEVDSYLAEPYHVRRVELALGLLVRELASSNAGVAKESLSVLELGSATGKVATALAEHGYMVTASDLAVPSDLSNHVQSRFRFIQLDASGEFPVPDCTFDAVYAGELIEHLFDTTLFLTECHRVLKSQGILVLTTPNLATWQDRLSFLFGVSPRQINALHEYLRLHIRPFNAGSLRTALERCGFKQKALLSNYAVLRLKNGRRLYSKWIARFWPAIGGSLIVAAQRETAPRHRAEATPPSASG